MYHTHYSSVSYWGQEEHSIIPGSALELFRTDYNALNLPQSSYPYALSILETLLEIQRHRLNVAGRLFPDSWHLLPAVLPEVSTSLGLLSTGVRVQQAALSGALVEDQNTVIGLPREAYDHLCMVWTRALQRDAGASHELLQRHTRSERRRTARRTVTQNLRAAADAPHMSQGHHSSLPEDRYLDNVPADAESVSGEAWASMPTAPSQPERHADASGPDLPVVRPTPDVVQGVLGGPRPTDIDPMQMRSQSSGQAVVDQPAGSLPVQLGRAAGNDSAMPCDSFWQQLWDAMLGRGPASRRQDARPVPSGPSLVVSRLPTAAPTAIVAVNHAGARQPDGAEARSTSGQMPQRLMPSHPVDMPTCRPLPSANAGLVGAPIPAEPYSNRLQDDSSTTLAQLPAQRRPRCEGSAPSTSRATEANDMQMLQAIVPTPAPFVFVALRMSLPASAQMLLLLDAKVCNVTTNK